MKNFLRNPRIKTKCKSIASLFLFFITTFLILYSVHWLDRKHYNKLSLKLTTIIGQIFETSAIQNIGFGSLTTGTSFLEVYLILDYSIEKLFSITELPELPIDFFISQNISSAKNNTTYLRNIYIVS